MNYTINIIVHDVKLAEPVKESLSPLPVNVFNGNGYPSFSKLCNDVIVNNPTEIIIICSYKVRPTPKDINKMISLINKGYGIVALYRFAFFGFTKEFIKRNGFFDERFISGGYEDSDMIRRTVLNNIAYYASEEIEYHKKSSTWGSYSEAKKHFDKKWKESRFLSIRLMDDEQYNYDIGDSITRIKFLDNSYSKVLPPSRQWFNCMMKHHFNSNVTSSNKWKSVNDDILAKKIETVNNDIFFNKIESLDKDLELEGNELNRLHIIIDTQAKLISRLKKYKLTVIKNNRELKGQNTRLKVALKEYQNK